MLKIKTGGVLSGDMDGINVNVGGVEKTINAVYVKKEDGTTTKVWPSTIVAEDSTHFQFGCGTNKSKTAYNTTTRAMQITATNSDTMIVAEGVASKIHQNAEGIFRKSGGAASGAMMDSHFPLACAMNCAYGNLMGLRVQNGQLQLYSKHNGSWDLKRTWAAPAVGDKISLTIKWVILSGVIVTECKTWIYKNDVLIGDDAWRWELESPDRIGVPGYYIRNMGSSMLNQDLWSNLVYNSWD